MSIVIKSITFVTIGEGEQGVVGATASSSVEGCSG
jgi:flavin reductase (DIM6/NTAB) family NADH-FMN oxidoreductase RutF